MTPACFRTIVEAQGDFICRFAPDGRVTYVNPALAAHLGREVGELVGLDVFDLLFPDDPAGARARALTPIPVSPPCGAGQAGPDDGREAGPVPKTAAPTAWRVRSHGPGGHVWREWVFRELSCPCAPEAGILAVGRDVTELVEALEAARGAERRYRTIFENAPIGIFRSTLSGRFLEVNPALATILGYGAPAEAVAAVTDISRDVYANPGRREEILKVLGGDPGLVVFEDLFRRKDGSTFNGRIFITLSRDEAGGPLYIDGLAEDITDQKRIEEELRRSERTARSLLNATLESAFLLDVDGVVLGVNENGARRLGVASAKDMVGQSFSRFVPWDVFEQRMERMQEVFCQGRPQRFEGEREGNVFDILLSPVFNPDGSVGRVALFAQDITERRRLERLREDVERITRHDMKTPLIGIIGFAQLLRKNDNLTDKQREFLSYIEMNGRQMMDFIKKSLDLFKMEQRVYRPDCRYFDLSATLSRIGRDLAYLAEAKNVSLRVVHQGREHVPDQEIPFYGEEMHLESLFANLVKNAVEAAWPGSLVTVTIQSGRDSHEVDIHNPGAVPDELRETFFERYATSGKSGGTGLGTYIARLIARNHGGDIRYTTDEIEGTHLLVSLPAGPRFPDEPRAVEKKP